MRKFFRTLTVSVNLLVLLSMVAIGAFHIQEVAAEEWVNAQDPEEILCLQQNIYFEARNQSTLGQVAVAWVTMNRVIDSRFPDTICGVVWQDKQFSWTHDGRSDKPGNTVLEQQAWRDAGLIARVVLLDLARGRHDPTNGADHYHADYVKPSWSKHGDRTVKVDNHIFYTVSW